MKLARKAPREWEDIYRLIRKDIFALCRLLKFKPTHQQVKVLQAVQSGEKRICVKASQGVGKSSVSAVCAIFRVIQDRNSRVIITAPSMRQAQDIFLRECWRLITDSDCDTFKELFFPTMKKIYVGSSGKEDDSRPDWGIMAVTATDPRNFQGYHGKNISFFVDESSGVEQGIMETIEGTLTQPGVDYLHMHTGNPNVAEGAFYDLFTKKRALWKCFTFDSLTSPLVSKEHCEYMKAVYGEKSDVYRIRVLGEFPTMQPNAVMSLDDVEACTRNDPIECVKKSKAKQFGTDLARYGSDESVIAQRSGLAIVNFETYAKKDPNDVVRRSFIMQAECDWSDEECSYVTDADGMGQGVMARYHDAEKNIHEFHTSGVATRRDFHDRMSEAWFHLGKFVRERACFLPNDRDLVQQLTTRLYEVTDKGKIKIESKQKYKDRTEASSPDRADAVVMAFYDATESEAQINFSKG